jgi:hypothetical protein
MEKSKTQKENSERILEIESLMQTPDFWNNSQRAQSMIRELQELKDTVAGIGKFDKGDAIMTIFSGAGRDRKSYKNLE